MNIEPPPGVAQPEVIEDYGASTSVNNDIRRRVWVAHIPAAGSYRITTDGEVNAYIDPRLAFGYPSRLGWLPWVFGAMLVLGLIDLAVALWLMRRRGRIRPASGFADFVAAGTDADVPDRSSAAAGVYSPTDQAIRIQQIKHLAALRDSGALTDEEFEQEKRRVLDG